MGKAVDVLDAWSHPEEAPPAAKEAPGAVTDVLGSWTHSARKEATPERATVAGAASTDMPDAETNPDILANREREDLSQTTAKRVDWEAAQSPIVGLLGGRAEASQFVNRLHPAIAAALGPAALIATGGAAPEIAAGAKSIVSPLAQLLTHKGVQYGITATGLETLDQMLGGHITRTLFDLLPRH